MPKDSLMAIVSLPRHMDDEVYPQAKTFDGFRFCKPHSTGSNGSDTEEIIRESKTTWTNSTSKLTTLSTDFLLFGIGEHAW